MTILGVHIFLGESEIEYNEEAKETSREKAKRSILKEFEKKLDEHLHVEERNTELGLEITYSAGLVDFEELVRNSLSRMELADNMISLLEEANMMEKFTYEDSLNLNGRDGAEAIKEFIATKSREEY